MITIILEKWNLGLDKVGLTNLQRQLLNLSLSEAKENTDKLLDGETIKIQVRDVLIAEEFIKQAHEINAICRYEEEVICKSPTLKASDCLKNKNIENTTELSPAQQIKQPLVLKEISIEKFRFKADKIIKINDHFLILFHIINEEVQGDRNVILLNSQGNIIWQIEKNQEKGWGGSYTNIYLNEENRLCAYSWGGIEYYLSIEDGSVEPHAFLK